MNAIKHRAENLNNGGSVTVYYCGYEKCESGHFWGPAVRNQYLLHYVISGCGTDVYKRQVQQAMLTIKKKFGKNAILKGMNLSEGATAKDRNAQIGGHKA